MVKNILKDGTVLADMTGHVVKKENVPMVYQIIEQITRKERKDD